MRKSLKTMNNCDDQSGTCCNCGNVYADYELVGNICYYCSSDFKDEI